MRLVSNIRDVERSLGDGRKRVYAGELPQIEKLRRGANPPRRDGVSVSGAAGVVRSVTFVS
jgi:sialic acid synthase SpsE